MNVKIDLIVMIGSIKCKMHDCKGTLENYLLDRVPMYVCRTSTVLRRRFGVSVGNTNGMHTEGSVVNTKRHSW